MCWGVREVWGVWETMGRCGDGGKSAKVCLGVSKCVWVLGEV